MTNNNKKYTVWCGGVEVNDYYLTLSEAKKLEQEYIGKGYNDVVVEKIEKDFCRMCESEYFNESGYFTMCEEYINKEFEKISKKLTMKQKHTLLHCDKNAVIKY